MKKNKSRRKNSPSISLLKRKFFGKSFFRGFGIALFLFLLLSYVFQAAEMTRETYLIQTYNREIKNILEESRRSEYGFLRSSSASKAEELVEELNFVRIKEAHYIDISEYQVAAR